MELLLGVSASTRCGARNGGGKAVKSLGFAIRSACCIKSQSQPYKVLAWNRSYGNTKFGRVPIPGQQIGHFMLKYVLVSYEHPRPACSSFFTAKLCLNLAFQDKNWQNMGPRCSYSSGTGSCSSGTPCIVQLGTLSLKGLKIW